MVCSPWPCSANTERVDMATQVAEAPVSTLSYNWANLLVESCWTTTSVSKRARSPGVALCRNNGELYTYKIRNILMTVVVKKNRVFPESEGHSVQYRSLGICRCSEWQLEGLIGSWGWLLAGREAGWCILILCSVYWKISMKRFLYGGFVGKRSSDLIMCTRKL